jgi:hypothetical protein
MDMWPRAERLVWVALLVAAQASAQQSAVLDEGSFTLTRAAAPYGTETFKIIRHLGAQGVEYISQSTRTIEGKVIRSALTADSAGSPTSYTRATTGGSQGRITASRAMNRLTVNEDGANASSKDFVFGQGSLILDDDVIHQLYFVTWREPRSIRFVSPASRRAGQAVLTEVGRESVTIGRTNVSAVKYVFGEGDDKREIWIDSNRRLLKVAHPARQLIGTRDQLPR